MLLTGLTLLITLMIKDLLVSLTATLCSLLSVKLVTRLDDTRSALRRAAAAKNAATDARLKSTKRPKTPETTPSAIADAQREVEQDARSLMPRLADAIREVNSNPSPDAATPSHEAKETIQTGSDLPKLSQLRFNIKKSIANSSEPRGLRWLPDTYEGSTLFADARTIGDPAVWDVCGGTWVVQAPHSEQPKIEKILQLAVGL